MKKKYVLKNRRRFFSILSITILLGISFIFTSNVYGNKPKTYHLITVCSGDTLWNIAERYSKNDIREYIYEVKSLNKLESSIIYPGSQLKLPEE